MNEETIKLEVDIPIRYYRGLEYICSLEPKQDIKSLAQEELKGVIGSFVGSDWADQSEHHNNRLKKILEGMDEHSHNFNISGEIFKKFRELENLIEQLDITY